MKRWIISAIAGAACCFGVWQAARVGTARTLARKAAFVNDLTAADRAVRLLPADAATHTARGGVLQRTGSYAEAGRELEQAVQLRPRDYFLWMLLGVARDLNGDQAGAVRALRQSVALAPVYAKPRWLLGNVLLRSGQVDEAFQELRLAAASDETLLANVIDLGWGITRNDPARTIAFIRPQTDSARMRLAIFFARQKQGTPAIEQFRSTAHLSDETANALMGELIKSKLFVEGYEVWTRIHRVTNREPSLLNGSFEDDIPTDNVGFGWLIRSDVANQTISVDASQHQSGARSFRIDFHGDASAASSIVSQLIVVEPNRKYRLTFQASSKDLVSAAAPTLSVTDASDEKQQLLSQAALAGVHSWREFVIDFSTGGNTQAILLALERRCTVQPCAAFGTLWLDSFRLEARP